MFQNMRRKNQLLTETENKEILNRRTAGVLALLGADGYPYSVPLSYVYHGGKIYFHTAKSGHKLDAIRNCEKASFCVIDQDEIIPEEYTSYFKSVIAFGTLRILEDEQEKRNAFLALAEKYSPEQGEDCKKVVERNLLHVCMLEFTIQHLTGKQALDLVKANNASV